MKQFVNCKNAPKAVGPYSQAVIIDKFMFVSGVLPIDHKTEQLVYSDIKIQTQMVISNIDSLLKEVGMNADCIIKTTCFIDDMKYFQDFNEIYEKYFISKPARSCVAVKSLPKGALVEIEIIAYKE